MKIGTLITGAGVETTIELNYLPQYLNWTAATPLTGIRVSVAGVGVITDLNALGIAAVSGIRRYGQVSDGYVIPLSDGLIPGKVVTIVITNSGAQTPKIFAHSLKYGSVYITNLQQTVLASSGATLSKFAQMAIISPAIADLITVTYQNGLNQDFEYTELPFVYTLYANEVDAYCIDNVEGNVKQVRLTPSADRKVVLTQYRMK